MAKPTNRRHFLKASAAVGAGFWVATREGYAKSRSPNEKINVACIGVGGKGRGEAEHALNFGNLVAICDVRPSALNEMAKAAPKAKVYKDFRKMLEEMEKDIDAVTVSTPDHTHAFAAMSAMMCKKHVYCQKPLCHDVYEARMLTQAAKKFGVVTQMGNQGTSTDGLRKAAEVVQSGMIGPVSEVHVWTNRPIWPQGAKAILNLPAVKAALSGEGKPDTEPEDVDWDLWLTTSPNRPFQKAYQPFNWRGWWDWGTGALGDMACHTANMAFMACQLGSPISLQAEVSEFNPQSFPMWSVVNYEFPERKGRNGTLPPLKWIWYDGGSDKPLWVSKKLKELTRGRDVAESGSLIVGEKAVLYSPNDYGADWMLLPDGKGRDEVKVDEFIPRAPRQFGEHKFSPNGDNDMDERHGAEWYAAMQQNKPELCMSNFGHAGPLTETVVLGCIAQRIAPRKLPWDGAALKFVPPANAKDDTKELARRANSFIKRNYRKGWELEFSVT